MIKAMLWLLVMLMMPMTPLAHTDAPAPPLDAADFALALPGGAYNMATDSREDLERVTGKAFEFYDEFPDLGIAYDRLLTDEVNFFAQRDGGPVDQAHFKQGMATARGIALGSTYAEVVAAYGELPHAFVEHGFMRADYEWIAGDADYALNMVINVDVDQVTDITLNYHP